MFGCVGQPCREYNGKSCSVSYVINCTDFVFQTMGSPVFFTAYSTCTVMSYCTRPHDIGTCIIVIRFAHYAGSFVYDCFHYSFTHTVGYFHTLSVAEITFHDVCHHIRNAAGCLPRRQCISQLRIHYGKDWPENFRSAYT